MALSFVAAGSGDGATITIPVGHQGGDIIFIYAYRSALTAPSLPAGWTNIINTSSSASAARCAYRVAGSTSEVSGTWTNATGLICAVYRGQATNKTPLKSSTTAGGSSVTASYNGIIPLQCPGSSWILTFAAATSTTTTLENPPTASTLRSNTVGATCEYACFDTNGTMNSWTFNSVALGSTAEWKTLAIEILVETLGPINNFQFVRVGDGMSVSEKIR